ncbi:MAG TPA: amino acid permease [Candidatus Polarisedimenticolaceae bacterium]|nr:amino acid permease [Candidatus Polarisedimenticolaceae bacterium]
MRRVLPERSRSGLGLGTAPVFLASISTILGAVLFLRFGYSVANVGFLGTLAIIVLGHLVTIPTALAIAEISTNRRVEGGGEYFIVSRSFGASIGGAIGVSLYLSQAVSVAFYMIAFAEAFQPLAGELTRLTGIAFDPRMVSLPGTVLLAALVLTRGASMGVKALWAVVSVLALSLIAFSLGHPTASAVAEGASFLGTVEGADPFMLVFAIVFPAFTGMTAGVGFSGDLANPRRSLPLGVLSATVLGMLIYVWIAYKLAASATPAELAAEQLVMQRIALWGPIIPIGLACATLSSAIGSILIAPRTLQALAVDGIFPLPGLNRSVARGVGDGNEPRNATLVTSAIALVTVALGNVDLVARIISMFFMVTYGALCSISALEHFAARPSYRPSFRSKWYISLLGAVVSFMLMFQIDPFFALLAITVMTGLYLAIRRRHRGARDLAAIFQGVMTQATRYSQIRLQGSAMVQGASDWRPSVIMVNGRTFERSAPIQFFGWLTHRYGVGTYMHFIQGGLSKETYRESRTHLDRLIRMMQAQRHAIYVDTLISPSLRSALAQALQLPGISGLENNCILFEFAPGDDDSVLEEAREGIALATATRVNSLVLRHGENFFGARRTVHVWLTWHDYRNANLMALLAYVLLGHPDWRAAEVRIFAAYPRPQVDERQRQLEEMIVAGRLPISPKNLRVIATDADVDFDALVERSSRDADLVILGFTEERLSEKGVKLFRRHPALKDVLFVLAEQQVLIE